MPARSRLSPAPRAVTGRPPHRRFAGKERGGPIERPDQSRRASLSPTRPPRQRPGLQRIDKLLAVTRRRQDDRHSGERDDDPVATRVARHLEGHWRGTALRPRFELAAQLPRDYHPLGHLRTRGPGLEEREPRMQSLPQPGRTATTASTSTGIPSGRSLVPIAEHAPEPRSSPCHPPRRRPRSR